MPDQTLKCCDCGGDFVFSERDQEFFASQNPPFKPPKRCKPCRQIKKAQNQTKPDDNSRNAPAPAARWTNGSEPDTRDRRPRQSRDRRSRGSYDD